MSLARSWQAWGARVYKAATDCVFPLFCCVCAREGAAVCAECARAHPCVPVRECPVCRRPGAEGRCCSQCVQRCGLDGLIAVADYHNPVVAGLIKKWKYEFIREAGGALQAMISSFVEKHTEVRDLAYAMDAVVSPVPLHRRRVCERGFNQAEALARAWADALRVPMKTLLRRARYTEPQAQQSGAVRKQMPPDVFALHAAGGAPHTVFLVDDVYTTGATMECAGRILRGAGAQEVWGVVSARET